MANDVKNKKVSPLPYDENGRPLAGLALPIVDGSGNITGWAPVSTVDEGDGTLTLRVAADIVADNVVLNIDPNINVEKYGGTEQTGADLTPLFEHLDTDLSDLDTKLQAISDNTNEVEGDLVDINTSLGTLIAKDYATETTLSLVKSNLDEIALDTDNLALIKAKTDNLDVALSTRATEATLALIKAKTDNLDTTLSSLKTYTKVGSTDQTAANAKWLKTAADGTVAVDGSAVIQPISATSLPLPLGAAAEATLATRLADATFAGRIGEVQASPTANTLLGRVKDIVTQLTTQVRGLFDSAGNAITSTIVGASRAVDVNVVQSQSSSSTAVDLGQAFGLAFDFSLPAAGTFNPVLLLKNPAASGKRIRITRINLGVTVSNVAAIWRIFVDPTTTANGTAVTPVNLNIGGASNPATISQTFTTPTVTANGTSIFRYEAGQNVSSTEIVGDALFVINPGHTLLLTGDPLSNNRNTVVTVYWTEVV